ncbi:hypothetical protein RchiOBHm_Chr6g0249851 [Rosa chinensis]|uniref:eIF2D winged helix domain-containing protein n=1 Tax=Rosa chinensis TaxID=74649 RepID=A0A2P6PKE1_ROSCH|nr:hypothetical protein RchiOBHm_Chr6g0249851 [Rosa chinensis]
MPFASIAYNSQRQRPSHARKHSMVWSNYVLPCRPSGITLDIKKSSHKKLSKWLQAKCSTGLVRYAFIFLFLISGHFFSFNLVILRVSCIGIFVVLILNTFCTSLWCCQRSAPLCINAWFCCSILDSGDSSLYLIVIVHTWFV